MVQLRMHVVYNIRMNIKVRASVLRTSKPVQPGRSDGAGHKPIK